MKKEEILESLNSMIESIDGNIEAYISARNRKDDIAALDAVFSLSENATDAKIMMMHLRDLIERFVPEEAE